MSPLNELENFFHADPPPPLQVKQFCSLSFHSVGCPKEQIPLPVARASAGAVGDKFGNPKAREKRPAARLASRREPNLQGLAEGVLLAKGNKKKS